MALLSGTLALKGINQLKRVDKNPQFDESLISTIDAWKTASLNRLCTGTVQFCIFARRNI